MEKLTLTKTKKGSKFLYEVKNENGEILASRTSKRDYVACTSNGEMFFGRLDLIGKGEHGRQLAMYEKGCNNTSEDDAFRQWCKESLEIIKKIAYLKQ